MGFCVATTVNTSDSGWLTPSSVTVRSSITSSRADCVFGGVRLISSATSSSVNTGPARNSNRLVCRLKTLVPRMSDGIRSGVNWMRLQSTCSSRATVRAMSVFAVPGTPSSSTCPPQIRASSSSSMFSPCPTTTRSARPSRCSTSPAPWPCRSPPAESPALKPVQGLGPPPPLPLRQVCARAQLLDSVQQLLHFFRRPVGLAAAPGRKDFRRGRTAAQAQVPGQRCQEAAYQRLRQQPAHTGPLVDPGQGRGVVHRIRLPAPRPRRRRPEPHGPGPDRDAGHEQHLEHEPVLLMILEVAPEAAAGTQPVVVLVEEDLAIACVQANGVEQEHDVVFSPQ